MKERIHAENQNQSCRCQTFQKNGDRKNCIPKIMQQSYADQKDHQTKTVVATAANSCQVRPQRNTAAAAQRMIWQMTEARSQMTDVGGQRDLNSEVGMRIAERKKEDRGI
jgi:hypothetical protein